MYQLNYQKKLNLLKMSKMTSGPSFIYLFDPLLPPSQIYRMSPKKTSLQPKNFLRLVKNLCFN